MITTRRYSHKLIINSEKRRLAENLCESIIGPRIYYLTRNVGGKKWYITTDGVDPGKIEIGVDDPKWLTILALQLT